MVGSNMRVGCDLDGVLADLHSVFTATAVVLFPELDGALTSADVGGSPFEENEGGNGEPSEVPASPSAERRVPLTRRQVDAVWKQLAAIPNFWETLNEIEPGSVKRLATIAEAERWDVIFLTSRPRVEGRTLQRQTQLWLDRMGFSMPSVFVVQGSRGRIADALSLDVVIDDRPENCLDVALESKARAILVWRGAAASVPASAKRLGIGAVSTVAACLDLIVEAQHSANTPLDFTQRLRRLLGLQPRASTKT
jgi:hypothetical protein